MAHHKSAKKRIRRNESRRTVNRDRVSCIRTKIKKVELAAAAGNKEEAQAAFLEAMPEIHRGVTKGVMHKNTAARRISRLSALVRDVA